MKHVPAAFVLSFGLVSCFTTDAQRLDQQELEMHREFALRLLDEADLRAAQAQVNAGLEIDEDDEKLLMIQARIHLLRGTAQDVREAEQVLREFAGPDNFIASVGLAEALERQGVLHWESAAAIEKGERATGSPDPVARANELRDKAREYWADATKWYERASEIKPDYIATLNGLQRVWALRGDLPRSLASAEKLLELATRELEYWKSELDRADIGAGYESELRRRLRAGTRLLTETHLTASTLLVSLKRPEDALAHLGQAADLEPSRAEIYSRRAQIELSLGRTLEACGDLERFVGLSTLPLEHPDMVRAIDLLAQSKVKLENNARSNP